MEMTKQETEFPYMVIYNKNEERGCGITPTDDIVEEFETYEEAKECYDRVKVDKDYGDWTINWKHLYKVEVLE